MTNNYPTRLIRSITKATDNQLKYWVRIGLVTPEKKGKTFFYSFKDIIKLRLLIKLKENGLSLQKIKKGIKKLSEMLPAADDPLAKLVIYTDGVDMLVIEKGNYFSATTMQKYFQFDTAKIKSDIIYFNNNKAIESEDVNNLKIKGQLSSQNYGR